MEEQDANKNIQELAGMIERIQLSFNHMGEFEEQNVSAKYSPTAALEIMKGWPQFKNEEYHGSGEASQFIAQNLKNFVDYLMKQKNVLLSEASGFRLKCLFWHLSKKYPENTNQIKEFVSYLLKNIFEGKIFRRQVLYFEAINKFLLKGDINFICEIINQICRMLRRSKRNIDSTILPQIQILMGDFLVLLQNSIIQNGEHLKSDTIQQVLETVYTFLPLDSEFQYNRILAGRAFTLYFWLTIHHHNLPSLYGIFNQIYTKPILMNRDLEIFSYFVRKHVQNIYNEVSCSYYIRKNIKCVYFYHQYLFQLKDTQQKKKSENNNKYFQLARVIQSPIQLEHSQLILMNTISFLQLQRSSLFKRIQSYLKPKHYDLLKVVQKLTISNEGEERKVYKIIGTDKK